VLVLSNLGLRWAGHVAAFEPQAWSGLAGGSDKADPRAKWEASGVKICATASILGDTL